MFKLFCKCSCSKKNVEKFIQYGNDMISNPEREEQLRKRQDKLKICDGLSVLIRRLQHVLVR